MEEELNEDELEDRLYAMIHYADDTEPNVESLTAANHHDAPVTTSTPKTNVFRRYWCTGGYKSPHITLSHKTTPQNTEGNPIIEKSTNPMINHTQAKPKEVKDEIVTTEAPFDKSVFQSPISSTAQRSIQVLENEEESKVVELESSDEDEVIEVVLPPKPTIMIESSDDDEVQVLQSEHSATETNNQIDKQSLNSNCKTNSKRTANRDREVSASPVPSVVSSVSDEFIRGDCIALNISSRRSDQPSFDFSLHGTDLLGQSTPSSKKKRKKKNKEKDKTVSISILNATTSPEKSNNSDGYFATPKNKSNKNKKQKTIQKPDVYDSDSNQSFIVNTNNKRKRLYTASEQGIPNVDVYESDSNQSFIIENHKELEKTPINQMKTVSALDSSDSSISTISNEANSTNTIGSQQESTPNDKDNQLEIVDLTNDYNITLAVDLTPIEDDILMANVTGLDENVDLDISESNTDSVPQDPIIKLGSTKVPAILEDNLDFDNLKGTSVASHRRYSLTTLRAEMEKFYNESWGGENFNHREIQKSMSRDKSLWAIDPRDRMSSLSKRRITCNYCNRPGHRDDSCRLKPPVCHMCGTAGHYEPRCPRKICVNCGSPNYMYSTMCRNCSSWNRITCPECGQNGHPYTHCPDIWRRYHNTVDYTPLEESHQTKKYYQMYCSGCTRRGHLVHTCRAALPFSGLPVNSPYVALYRPLYPLLGRAAHPYGDSPKTDRESRRDSLDSSFTSSGRKTPQKRRSKSPTAHASHINKRRNTAPSDGCRDDDAPQSVHDPAQRKVPTTPPDVTGDTHEAAPDYIPITSSNRDKMGQVIQDNEVSDTSDAVTMSRIYVTKDIIDRLNSLEGEQWLRSATENNDVVVSSSDADLYLSIKGKVGDQESFQSDLRLWTQEQNKDNTNRAHYDAQASLEIENSHDERFNIPKNRNNALRKLNKAFHSLKQDLGDPNKLFKELTYLQNHHKQLLNKKAISPKQVTNNRDNINGMLKKLNMVLLGQAGLADGTRHLNELYSIQEKLVHVRQKNISKELRDEIGQHYHLIFTSNQRSDYDELLKKYYGSRGKNCQLMFKKKVKYDNLILNPKHIQIKQFNRKPKQMATNTFEEKMGANEAPRPPLVGKTMNKLVFYHRRLLQARPSDAVLKKTRFELVKKLHSHISVLGTDGKVSVKALRKMKRVQAQAQLFLTNV